MPAALPQSISCCDPCNCEDILPSAIPGPQGPAGADGTDGTDGVNAYTTLAASVTMPAELLTVSATVVQSSSFTVGQIVFVQFLGYMKVTAKADSTHMTLQNLRDTPNADYVSNAIPGTVAPIGSFISPAGLQGPNGSLLGVAGGDLTGNYPNPLVGIGTTKGDLLVSTGGGVGNMTRLASGADGTRPRAHAAAGVGIDWQKVDISAEAEVTGTLAIGNGGTGGDTAAAARTALAVAASGANSDITSLTALSTPLSIGQGGTAGTTAATARSGLGLTKPTGSTAYIAEQQVANTAAGTFTTGAWRTRAINTEVFDADGIVSIAASQFTLIAGTYRLTARAPAYKVDLHQLRLYNITDGSTVATGTSAKAAAADACVTDSWVRSRFTIAGAKTFEIQHSCSATEATDGMGIAANQGITETYCEVWIEKEVG